LKEHFNLEPNDSQGLHEVLGVDFRGISAPYRGPRLHEDIPERGVKVDNWGIHRRWIEHDTGGYWDFCDFPLRNAGEEAVANWPMPSPDDHDYSRLREACERYEELRHIYRGGRPGLHHQYCRLLAWNGAGVR